jgi:tetratricopeptide (TPR) repeat protein
VLALVLAACVAQTPASRPEAAAALLRGDAAHAAFEYAAARAEYERALAIEPESVEARARLAHVLGDLAEEAAAEGREAEARPLLDRALALAEGLQRDAPERPEGHYAVAATLGHLTPFLSGPGKVAAARRIDASARRAAELEPCLAPAYTVLAITYRELSSLGGFVRGLAQAALGGLPKGTLDDAEGLLRAAVALDPQDPFPHYQLALTREKQGRPAEAAAELQQSIALPERERRDRRNRADAEARLRRIEGVDSTRR